MAVAWAVALSGRADVGEELAQEALLRTAARLDTIAEPVAYLRTAVVNACRSWHRANGRRQRRERMADAGRPATALLETSVEMLELLDGLPFRQRTALVLRYWAGWTDSEIAEALGCRQGSVRVFLSRGLASLRVTFSRLEEDR